ncbi:MAG: hypothetical protein ACD_58C00179G0003 [uncultured bacterium]|nr:MAG: hypothetical protein ACD_58C00179G0003 [uncultured bacterium]
MFLKKILFIVLTVVTSINLIVFFALPVSAQGISAEMGKQLNAAAGSSGAGFDAPTDPRTIIANIIKIVLGLLGTIFLCLTLYAGYLWMTAAGNDEQVTTAKTLLTQATVGLAIILAANSIVYFVAKIAIAKPGPSTTDGLFITPKGPDSFNPSPY